MEDPLWPAYPSVPRTTPNTPIRQYSPAPPPVPPPPVYPSPITVPSKPCRISLKIKGNTTSKSFQYEIYAPHDAQYFLATLIVPTKSDTDISLDYLADLNTYLTLES